MDRSNLKAEDCDGQILNAETLKKYEGYKTHISRQCSLLMRSTQLAGEKPAGKTFVAYVLPDRSSKAVTANLVDASTSEEDKIEDIKLQSNNEYASINELDPEPTVNSAPVGHQSRPLRSHRGRGRHWERAGPREGAGSPSPFRSRSPIGLRNRSPDLYYKSRSIRDRDGMSPFPRDYTHHGRGRRGALPDLPTSSLSLGTKSKEYASINYFKKPCVPPPPDYICNACGETDHHIQECPMLLDKRPDPKPVMKSEGVPHSFMMKAEPGTKGDMLTNIGENAIPAIDAEAYSPGKKECPPLVADQDSPMHATSQGQPPSPVELDPEPTVNSAPVGHQSRPLHSHRGRGRHWERAGPREGAGSPSPFRSRSPIGLRNRSPDLYYKSRSIRDRDGMSPFPRDYTHHGRGRRGALPHHPPCSFPLGTKSKEYASINYFKKPCVPPPPDYICNACGESDHHIQECPMLLDKRPDPKPVMKSEGVPHSFMVKAEPGTKGDMLTNIGENAIPAIDVEAYSPGKKECPPLVADQDSPMHATSQGQPPSPVELDPEPTVNSAPVGHQSRPLRSHRGRGRHWERGERAGMSLFPRDYTHHGRGRRGAPPHHPPCSFPLGTKSRTKVFKTKTVPKKRPREDPEQSDHSVDRDDSPKRKRVKALHRGSPA